MCTELSDFRITLRRAHSIFPESTLLVTVYTFQSLETGISRLNPGIACQELNLEDRRSSGYRLEGISFCMLCRLYRRLFLYRLFLFDWKITDPEEHRKWTGQDNRLIRENLEMLYREGAEIILRCPVIPGVNDTPEHFRGIGKLTEAFPRIRQVDLLPYHALGNNKRRQLGLPEDGFRAPDEETAARWQKELQAACRVPVCR